MINMIDMIKEEYKYSALTEKIIGCAMEVHKVLGNGFQEVIYQRALAIESDIMGLNFKREFEMPIFYKKNHIGTRRVDFLVEDIISVELKAIVQLEPVHLAQAINYLEAYNLEIGLLINFGETKLRFHRLENKKFKPFDHVSHKNQKNHSSDLF
jgi:GxxExxY protein